MELGQVSARIMREQVGGEKQAGGEPPGLARPRVWSDHRAGGGRARGRRRDAVRARMGDACPPDAGALRRGPSDRDDGRARDRHRRAQLTARRAGAPAPAGSHDPAYSPDGGRAAAPVAGRPGGSDAARAAEAHPPDGGHRPGGQAAPSADSRARGPASELGRVRHRLLGVAYPRALRSGVWAPTPGTTSSTPASSPPRCSSGGP